MRMAPAIAVFTAAMVFSTSCSFIFVRRAPTKIDEGQYPDCTDRTVAPLFDGLFGVLSALGLLSALGEDSNDFDGGGDDAAGALTVALFAGGFLTSMVYGFKHTNKCRNLRLKVKDISPPDVDFTREPELEEDFDDDEPASEYGGAGRPCYGNNTCNSGLYCNVQKGLCVPGNRGSQGGPCLEDNACNPGLTCDSGVCSIRAEDECRADDHCPQGEVCEEGQCIPAPIPAPI